MHFLLSQFKYSQKPEILNSKQRMATGTGKATGEGKMEQGLR